MPRQLVVGRGPSCGLLLSEPGISAAHSEFGWAGTHWYVRDLGSRNGTFVDGVRLEPGARAELMPLTEVRIGSRRLTIVELNAPRLLASAGDEQREASDNLLFLPDEEAPSHTIYHERDGLWIVESSVETRYLDDGDIIVAGGRSWTIVLPGQLAETFTPPAALSLAETTLRFIVSSDEKHIEMHVVPMASNSCVIELEGRAHLAMLLALARFRLEDAARPELSASEHGWRQSEDLPKMLAVEPELIHVWIHRARKQLSCAGIRDSAWIVERRARGSQLRIGVSHLVVHSG